jgi:hypothetical protein
MAGCQSGPVWLGRIFPINNYKDTSSMALGNLKKKKGVFGDL